MTEPAESKSVANGLAGACPTRPLNPGLPPSLRKGIYGFPELPRHDHRPYFITTRARA